MIRADMPWQPRLLLALLLFALTVSPALAAVHELEHVVDAEAGYHDCPLCTFADRTDDIIPTAPVALPKPPPQAEPETSGSPSILPRRGLLTQSIRAPPAAMPASLPASI